jgi:Hpt domain
MQGIQGRESEPRRTQDKPGWAEAIQTLRAEYLQNSAAKLDAIAGLIERLEGQPSGEALGDLRTRFHGLHGSGLTYGFPAVSVLGGRGEEACQAAIKADSTPSPRDFAEWRIVLDALHRELDRRTPSIH